MRSFLLFLIHPFAVLAGPSLLTSCNNDCKSCQPSSRLLYFQKTLIKNPSPCPEGSVASIQSLQATYSRSYKIIVSNPGGSYVYQEALVKGGGGMCLGGSGNAVIGDQTEIQVELQCRYFFTCLIQWNVQFGCEDTGVLMSNEGGGFQVISDIDDTLVSSDPGGCESIVDCSRIDEWKSHLAGSDKRLERGEFYPGVAELLLGLSLGPNSDENNQDFINPSKPLFLSARPREAKAILSISQNDSLNLHLEQVGQTHNYPSWGGNVDQSFYGTILDGVSHREFGQTKAMHYNALRVNRPNTRVVFLGDNGQGDVCAAQSMLEEESSSSRPGQMAAVFIHLAKSEESTLQDCQHPDGTKFSLNLPEGDRVHYHKTHADATQWALDQGLISCTSARWVYDAIVSWLACRCPASNDSNSAMPSSFKCAGAMQIGTREETLTYCKDVMTDLASLRDTFETACREETTGGGAETTVEHVAVSSLSSTP